VIIMEQKNLIIIAVVAVVAVVAAASAVVLMNNGGGGSSSYSYTIYTEVINSDGTEASHDTVSFSIATKDNATFIEGANKAFEAAGMSVTFVDTGTYITVKYNGGGSNATYYFDSSTKNWVAVSSTTTQYVGNSNLALMLDYGYVSKTVYDALTVTNQAGFKDDPNMDGDYDYVKLPDYYPTSPGQYTYYNYYEKIAEDGTISSTGSVRFYVDTKDLQSFADGLIAAYTYYGVGTMTADVSEASGIFWHFNDSTYNSCYYYDTSTSAWTFINDTLTEYTGNTYSALMLEHGFISKDVYDALSTEEQAGYNENPGGEGTDYAYAKFPGKTSI